MTKIYGEVRGDEESPAPATLAVDLSAPETTVRHEHDGFTLIDILKTTTPRNGINVAGLRSPTGKLAEYVLGKGGQQLGPFCADDFIDDTPENEFEKELEIYDQMEWDNMIKQLRDYHRKHPREDVNHVPSDSPLRSWLERQLRLYYSSNLSPEKINELKGLGVVFPASVASVSNLEHQLLSTADDNNGSAKNDDRKNKQKKDKKADDGLPPPATVSQVFSFLRTPRDKAILFVGTVSAICNGLVFPALAYLFSNSFSDLGTASQGLDNVRRLAFTFVGVGVYAFVVAALQDFCFLLVAIRASDNFRKEWFSALLRQDSAFHDVHSVSGMATAIAVASNKMKRGLGRKMGEGIQFGTTFVGGLVYAFISSWRVALVILALLPFVSFAAFALMQLNQSQTSNAQRAYMNAGAVSYGAVSSIRTVLSLNAVPEMIRQYSAATAEAYESGIGPLLKLGIVNGGMLGSFILLYAVLTLFGAYLLYSEVASTYCDPSAAVPGMTTCTSSGPSVFGSMLVGKEPTLLFGPFLTFSLFSFSCYLSRLQGVAFAAQGMSQLANSIEAFSSARSACGESSILFNLIQP